MQRTTVTYSIPMQASQLRYGVVLARPEPGGLGYTGPAVEAFGPVQRHSSTSQHFDTAAHRDAQAAQ
jgi:hypothetical protein